VPERLDLWALSEPVYKRMIALDGAVQLEDGLRHLVKLRASQINGCAFCIEMHGREAAEGGAPPHRLHGLAAWEEVDWYTDRERAALALTEAMTRLPDRTVTDDVVEDARRAFGDEELAQLIWAITVINAWNRIGVSCRMTPGVPA
jgi:AhpD family alkylhydroperoxidase